MSESGKEKKKQKREKGFLYYLSYKNLIGDIAAYGYTYTLKELLTAFVCMIAGCVVAGYLYKFKLLEYIVVIIAGTAMLPFFIQNGYFIMYQQHRFSDVTIYMEKMLYYFKAEKKIYLALLHTSNAFQGGDIADSVKRAIACIENTTDRSDIERAALECIEEDFPLKRIKIIHRYLLNAEQFGGDPSVGIKILLEDRKMWLERTLTMQSEMKHTKNHMSIACIITVFFCLCLLYFPFILGLEDLDITVYWYVGVSAVAMLIILMYFYCYFCRKIGIDWLAEEKNVDEKQMEEYLEVVNYDKKAEQKKALIYSMIPLVLTLFSYLVFSNKCILIVGTLLTIFVANSGEIGYKIGYKNILKQIQQDFPAWFMQVVLYMQNDNVDVSLQKSLADAPGVLKIAVERLIDELAVTPESPEPYNNFLKYFNLSEVNEAMSALYGIRMGAGENTQTQFADIMARTNLMLDKAERMRNEDSMAIFGTYIGFPAMIGTVKLAVDMVALMMLMFSQSSAIVR